MKSSPLQAARTNSKMYFKFLFLLCSLPLTHSLPQKPNLILFLADDMGYGDLSSYGHLSQEAGPVDKMAAGGLKLTQMYAAATFCTPSRAALLTGRQPFRSGMVGPMSVHLPHLRRGIHHDEILLPEALQQLGYKTGIVGKWHLGINNNTGTDGAYLPHTHGFDFVGTMLPFTLVTRCDIQQEFISQPRREACFLYRNTTIVQQPINLAELTNTLLTDAKTFLHENKDRPFFLYMSFPQVHTPMNGMPRFKGSSKRGAYGDTVNELQWAVGEILDTLTLLGLDRSTLSVFVSDHGPHREMCTWGGDAGPFKAGKGSYFEGGLRVPGIFHWPGVISPGSVSPAVTSLMDIFPTFVQVAGGDPNNITTQNTDNQVKTLRLDGRSMVDILSHNGSSRHEALFIYDSTNDVLMAVRYQEYKIYFRRQPSPRPTDYGRYCRDGLPLHDHYFASQTFPKKLQIPIIYNVEIDPGEQRPLEIDQYSGVLAEIDRLLTEEQLTWLDKRQKVLVRRHSDISIWPCCNPPFCFCYSKNSLSSHGVCEKR